MYVIAVPVTLVLVVHCVYLKPYLVHQNEHSYQRVGNLSENSAMAGIPKAEPILAILLGEVHFLNFLREAWLFILGNKQVSQVCLFPRINLFPNINASSRECKNFNPSEAKSCSKVYV